MESNLTAIEFLVKETPNMNWEDAYWADLYERAKEMEKEQIDNKVIHFAEWLTDKHTTVLMTLYEQFEEQYYNEEL